ncbi:MAG TPA: MSMEG_4193 family putative phosphomutase [Desertimonas sp.]|nr:MSMEG_4193 family putative phosphomutase [Desertimonas sp.]
MARSTKQRAATEERPTRVLLVRHGLTESTGSVLPGRAPGLNLSDTGRTQAQRTAELISDGNTIDAVYTSPLERARQTAAPIATATGCRAKVDRGLIECDFGEWTGQQLSALMKKPAWTTVQRAPSSFRFPDGESFVEMQLRMVSTIERLRNAHPGGTIVCVSHADPIKAAIAQSIGTHLDLFQRIVISPASVSVLAFLAGNPVVLSVNSTGRPLKELTLS